MDVVIIERNPGEVVYLDFTTLRYYYDFGVSFAATNTEAMSYILSAFTHPVMGYREVCFLDYADDGSLSVREPDGHTTDDEQNHMERLRDEYEGFQKRFSEFMGYE